MTSNKSIFKIIKKIFILKMNEEIKFLYNKQVYNDVVYSSDILKRKSNISHIKKKALNKH